MALTTSSAFPELMMDSNLFCSAVQTSFASVPISEWGKRKKKIAKTNKIITRIPYPFQSCTIVKVAPVQLSSYV